MVGYEGDDPILFVQGILILSSFIRKVNIGDFYIPII